MKLKLLHSLVQCCYLYIVYSRIRILLFRVFVMDRKREFRVCSTLFEPFVLQALQY